MLANELAALLPPAPTWWHAGMMRLRAAPGGDYRACYVLAVTVGTWGRLRDMGAAFTPFERSTLGAGLGDCDMELESPARFRSLAGLMPWGSNV